jgi:hypothetical protein
MANVVVVLVFTQVREVQAEASKKRPVVALQQPVETAHHRPLEPTEDRLRVSL